MSTASPRSTSRTLGRINRVPWALIGDRLVWPEPQVVEADDTRLSLTDLDGGNTEPFLTVRPAHHIGPFALSQI
jgi:hypothetical protein